MTALGRRSSPRYTAAMRLLGGPKLSADQKARIPPGQYFTEKWPVLHYGSVPSTDLATWDFRVWGEVARAVRVRLGRVPGDAPDKAVHRTSTA